MDDLQVGGTTLKRTAGTADEREVTFVRFVESRLAQHYRLAAVLLGDLVDAEDAVHDAVERAWRGWERLQDLDHFDAWVGRILVNECRDRLRRRRRRPVVNISDSIGDRLIAPDQLQVTSDRDEIGRAFAVLNPDQRIAVALRFYADLTVDQIALRVGVPAGTVKSRLHHALAAMNAELVRERAGGSLK
jgi:RNA polymerase sigma factor (sigma-70 family)